MAEVDNASEFEDVDEKKKKPRKLSARQQCFISEYLVDCNEEQAAIRAGYAKKSASSTGARLLKHPAIRQVLQEGQRDRCARTAITQDAVVRELAAVGFASLKDVCEWDDGHLRIVDSQALTDEQAASIAEITETVTSRGGTVRVKQHSKLKALEMLAKHVGLYDAQDGAQPSGALEELSPVLRKKLEAIYGTISLAGSQIESGDGDAK